VADAHDAALVSAQQRRAVAERSGGEAPALFGGDQDPDLLVEAERGRVVRLAGWPQALLGALPALAALALLWWAWPRAGNVPGGFGLGLALLLTAFPVLVVERRLTLAAANGPAQRDLPEAGGLARLVRLLLWTLVVAGAAETARGLGAGAAVYVLHALAGVVGVVTLEVVLRVLAAPFLPAAGIAEARGLSDSMLAGVLLPRLGAGTAKAAEIRDRFGIDLSQSWALGFVRAAALPLVLGLLVVAWLLSGVTALSLQERGVYERLGAPVAVLKSGLHVHLPWPFGVVRRLDDGAVHELAVGLEDVRAVKPRLPANATDTRQVDRIWRVAHDADALYVVPGSGQDAASRAAQVLGSDVRVFYRIAARRTVEAGSARP
jgi:hypothetical protein